MLSERDLLLIGKELLDGDPDRGVALLTLDREVLYANTAANTMLRDGTPRGAEGLVPDVVDAWLRRFVDRVRQARGALSSDHYYPDESEARLRISFESCARDDDVHVVLRVQEQTPWALPTVRRLQSRFGLTLREAQVAACVSRGHTNAEVAERLGIVEKTVKNVLMSVFSKCSVRNRVELALRAFDAPVPGLASRRPS